MPNDPAFSGSREPASGLVVLALFLAVFSTRLWMIATWGSATPSWDEWSAIALKLYRPWLQGSLGWADLLAPHNEHRIALTRLADLLLFELNGGWNPWWQLLLNAALHALTAAVLLRIFWTGLGAGARLGLTLLLAVLFSSTSGWQNALWAFQSQFYFCNLLSLLALAGLLLAPAFSRAWLLGWCAGLLALFSTGGGVFACVAAGAVLGLVWLRPAPAAGDRFAPIRIAPLLALAGLLFAGWCLHVRVPEHAPLHARDADNFFATFLRCLSWPWIDSPWLGAVLQAPFVLLLARSLRKKTAVEATDRLLLGLGLLVLLHALGVAYSRGGMLIGGKPASRYQDMLSFGAAVNGMILLRHFSGTRPGRLLSLAWCALLLTGLLSLTTVNLSMNLPIKRAQGRTGLEQIRRYLATRDAAHLVAESELLIIHPSVPVLQDVLDDPLLAPKLPAEFSQPDVPPPVIIRAAPWLAAGSGLLFIFALGRLWSRRLRTPSPRHAA